MRKLLIAATVALAPFFVAQPASALTISTDGTWYQADEFITPGSFFTTTWDFTCSDACTLDVSDWAVISDLYEVFDSAVSIGLTTIVPSWDALGCADAFDPACYTTDPDAAWADVRYSKASFLLAAGAHSITILTSFIPPTTAGGDPFPDSTVQLRINEVPLPATFGFLAAGLLGLGILGRRRKLA
jgi:hypothetical protein